MATVWLRVRSELRARRAATVVIVLLVSLVTSVALAAAIGARRTATVQERLVAAVDGRPNIYILDLGPVDPAAVEALPMVARTSVIRYLVSDLELDAVTSSDQGFGAQLIEGRIDPSDPLGAVTDRAGAEELGVELGDELELPLYSAAQWEAQDPSGGPQGPQPKVHIAGIVRETDDVDAADPKSLESLGSDATLSLPQAFLDRYGEEMGVFTNVFLTVELRGGGAAVPAFKAAVRELPEGDQLQFLDPDDTQNEAATARAVRLQALGLVLVALAVALAGMLTVGQMLVRHLRADVADAPTLEALGMTRGQRASVGLVRGAILGTATAVLAVAEAVVWSRFTPVGLARVGEPHPGIEVNLVMLAAGGVVILLLIAATATVAVAGRRPAPAGERAPMLEGGDRRPSLLALAGSRAGPVPSVAASLAFGGRASRRASSATVVALAAAVVTLTAGAVLVTSLDHVADEPARYGWTFDAVAGNPFETDPGDLFDLVAQSPGVDAVAGAANVTLEVDGESVAVVAVEPDAGIEIVPVDGREPRGPDEIALGRRTLDALGARIGGSVIVDAGGGTQELTVTGIVLVPEVGGTGTGLGEGGMLTFDGLTALVPEAQPNLALLRFTPGQRSRFIDAFAIASEDVQPLVEPFLPASLYQFVRIRSLPGVLGLLVTVLALGTLAQTLMGVGQRRRREVAVLKTLGLTRRQIAGSALCQAAAFTALALVIGLPLGAALGRLAWAPITDRLGLPDGPVVPVGLLAALVPAALVVTLVSSILPAWGMARRDPARSLRAE